MTINRRTGACFGKSRKSSDSAYIAMCEYDLSGLCESAQSENRGWIGQKQTAPWNGTTSLILVKARGVGVWRRITIYICKLELLRNNNLLAETGREERHGFFTISRSSEHPPSTMGVGATLSGAPPRANVISLVAWFVAIGGLLSLGTTIWGAIVGSRVVTEVETKATDSYRVA